MQQALGRGDVGRRDVHRPRNPGQPPGHFPFDRLVNPPLEFLRTDLLLSGLRHQHDRLVALVDDSCGRLRYCGRRPQHRLGAVDAARQFDIPLIANRLLAPEQHRRNLRSSHRLQARSQQECGKQTDE
ncbi:MAG: hypothetical protein EBS83_13705 [Planctomycetia bacterium]|nr:hypothetical protein [Planctomycetia bacterium]